MQGISFRIGEYKYKGSEIDRNFSLKNLQKTLQRQQKIELKPVLKTAGDNDPTEKLQETVSKELHQENSLLDQLLKPERMIEQTPYQLIRQQRKKKHSSRIH